MNLQEMETSLNCSIQNQLDLNFDFCLENNLIDLSDIQICNSELDLTNEICLNVTTASISDLIESTANFDELLQTDFSQFVFNAKNFDEVSSGSSNEASQISQLANDIDEFQKVNQLDNFSNVNASNSIFEVNSLSCIQLDNLKAPIYDDGDASLDSLTGSENSSHGRRRTKFSCGKVEKKESNKAAAIRYRSKKVNEKNQLFVECDLYTKKNVTLKQRIDELQTEISFIKSLLVEALIKRNTSS